MPQPVHNQHLSVNLRCFSSKFFPARSWGGSCPLCIQTPSMIQWHLPRQSILLLSSCAPKSVHQQSPCDATADTHWCCHSERVCAFFTHTRALRTAEKTNSASQDRSRVPSPGESSSETHFSLSVFPQNTKEQIKTLKWFWFNFTVYYLCNQAKYFRLDGTKNCSFPNTFI